MSLSTCLLIASLFVCGIYCLETANSIRDYRNMGVPTSVPPRMWSILLFVQRVFWVLIGTGLWGMGLFFISRRV